MKSNSNGNNPLISVIMSVYNEEKYIFDSINSILNQTIDDFEFIIVDDCSVDNTVSDIKSINDKRIHLICNTENCGLTVNLNKALKIAQGKYIARMDGDDISNTSRFEKQIKYLNKHTDVMLISCETKTFGSQNIIQKLHADSETLKCMMLVRPCLAHPGFMIRRELFEEYGYYYDESFRQAQDYDLAARVTRKFKIGICPYVLLYYRSHANQVSSTCMGSQFTNADRIRKRLLSELDIDLSNQQCSDYHKFITERHTDDIIDFVNAKKLVDAIVSHNKGNSVYNQKKLESTLIGLFCIWIIRNKSKYIFSKIHVIFGNNYKYYKSYIIQWLLVGIRKIGL